MGISFLLWPFSDAGFRHAEGYLEGEFCLPVSIGIALILLGWAVLRQWKLSAFWLALALVGQAVALQMIEAGPFVRYQHYISLSRLLTETHPALLIYLVLQTTLVLAGITTRWSIIRSWLGRNFKVWQLLGIGLVFSVSSATVSKDIFRYISELFFATFVQTVNLGNIVLMVWALPEEVLVSWKQKFDKFLSQPEKKETRKAPNIDRFAVLAALWVIVVASVLCLFSYQNHPHVPDEFMYLYQARYLANGLLTVPAPPVPEAFSFYMIPYESARWYSIFPPGWPAVLALGVLLGVPWLINPVLAGLNVLLSYVLCREISNRSTARIAVLLLCVSPWFIFMAMNFMSHTFTLTCALAAAVAIACARRTGKAMWGWLGGMATGMASLIRPLDGLIVAGILGLWSVGIGGRRLKFSSILAFVISAIMVGAVILPYNKQITGNPTVFPLSAYYEKYFGPKANALGFGPERGLGWAIDPFPGHSPVDALVNTNLNTFSVNIELFGWSTGSLLLIALLLFSKNKRKGDYLMLIIILVIAATYSLYWFSGGPDFGARYWYLMLVPLIGLTVRGIQMLQEKFNFRENSSLINSSRVIVAVLSLSVLSLINFFPWRAIDKYYHYRGMRPDIRQLAGEYGFGKSLVLIRGDSSDYQSAWAYNLMDFKADAPVYAWDKNLDIRTQLLNAYPDRPVWIIDGHSVTNAGFKVMQGPLLGQEILEETKKTAYYPSFSTYFGGSGWEHARDVFSDSQGNIYITGGTASSDFPITPGAYDTRFDPGHTGDFGPCDAFVSKFGPDGSLIWSTFLGGPGYDRAYAVEVDNEGYIYIAGRAGPGFPTKDAFQPTFKGVDNGGYGMQNAFVAKIKPDGSDLVWSSYVGVGQLCRDLAIDNKGYIYLPLGYTGQGGTPPSEWFANAFQKIPQGGRDCGVIKIKNDGSQVIWATWLGGSADDTQEASIRVDDDGYVYIGLSTYSDDIPTTPGVHDRTHSGDGSVDFYVARLEPNGSNLVYGTYLGGRGDQWISTHNLAIDNYGNAYVAVPTGADFPITEGVFQSSYGGGSYDWGVAKLSPTGALLASTLIGGNSDESPDGIYVDDSGNVFLAGETGSSDFPTTSDAYQSTKGAGQDAVVVVLSADFSSLVYSTFMGGPSYDNGRTCCLGIDGSIYVAGCADGGGWPTLNAYQSTFAGGGAGRCCGAGDCILAKFHLGGPDETPPSDDSNNNGGNGGGCFIATAAFGSYAEPHVKLLRDLRDQCLLTNRAGRWFVRMYYGYSPFWADLINTHTWCKPIVRLALMPLACIGYIMLKTSVECTLIAAVFLFVASVLSCSLCIRVSRR